jgi:hypothetical protein
MAETGWWCPECKAFVPGADVTYDERHDERVGGCGQPVGTPPQTTPDLAAAARALIHEWREEPFDEAHFGAKVDALRAALAASPARDIAGIPVVLNPALPDDAMALVPPDLAASPAPGEVEQTKNAVCELCERPMVEHKRPCEGVVGGPAR